MPTGFVYPLSSADQSPLSGRPRQLLNERYWGASLNFRLAVRDRPLSVSRDIQCYRPERPILVDSGKWHLDEAIVSEHRQVCGARDEAVLERRRCPLANERGGPFGDRPVADD